MKTTYSLVAMAALAVGSPLPGLNAKDLTQRSVDGASAAEYSVASWSGNKNARSVDGASAAEYSVASWSGNKNARSVDGASAAEYSVASWSGNKNARDNGEVLLTAEDIDDICEKLTGAGEDVNGIPIDALVHLCKILKE